MNEFKRKSRHLSPETRRKISQSVKALGSKSTEQRSRTSASMREYWRDDRNFPADADEHINK